MNGIRRILVAIKSPGARMPPAVLKAAQLAKALNAELILFQSVALPIYDAGDLSYMGSALVDAERAASNACKASIENYARPLRRKGIHVSVSVQFDYPIYEAIIREAIRLKADMIVADQHHGHRAASLLHLTDWELLRLSPVPVLLVKTAQPYRHPKILAAVDPEHTYAKPVWLDRAILEAAHFVATSLRGTLHAVHAYAPIPALAFPTGAVTKADVEAVYVRSAEQARKMLKRELRDAEIGDAALHLVGRHPSDAIVQVADEVHSALVVMGAISRTGLKRLLIGNTAERVLDRLSCDVMVIKPRHVVVQVPPSRRGSVSVRVQPTSQMP